MVRRLNRRAIGRVAHINHKAHTVHLGHDLTSHARQPRVIFLITSGSEQRLVVIRQLHEPQAKLVQDFD